MSFSANSSRNSRISGRSSLEPLGVVGEGEVRGDEGGGSAPCNGGGASHFSCSGGEASGQAKPTASRTLTRSPPFLNLHLSFHFPCSLTTEAGRWASTTPRPVSEAS
eukprot:1573911-Pyramimonas_sp.AAC.1